MQNILNSGSSSNISDLGKRGRLEYLLSDNSLEEGGGEIESQPESIINEEVKKIENEKNKKLDEILSERDRKLKIEDFERARKIKKLEEDYAQKIKDVNEGYKINIEIINQECDESRSKIEEEFGLKITPFRPIPPFLPPAPLAPTLPRLDLLGPILPISLPSHFSRSYSSESHLPRPISSPPQAIVLSINPQNQNEGLSDLIREIKGIITNPVIKNFLEDNGIYKKVNNWYKVVFNRNARNVSDLEEFSDDVLRNFATMALKINNQENINLLMSIIKGGESAINEALHAGKDEEIRFILLKLFQKKYQIFDEKSDEGKKISIPKILKYFLNSNLSLEGKAEEYINSAIHCRYHDFLSKLIHDDPDFFKNPEKNYELLHRAVASDSPKSVLLIYSAGCKKLDCWDSKGNTPLHCLNLSTKKNKDLSIQLKSQNSVFYLLLALGANPSIKNIKDEFPFDRLNEIDPFKDIVKLMKDYCKIVDPRGEGLEVVSRLESGESLRGEGGMAIRPRGEGMEVASRLESSEQLRGEGGMAIGL